MTLVAGAPFEAQEPAAALLMRKGHPAEAIPFLQELVTAMPWNAEYRVRLAQARLAVGREVEAARKELVAAAQDPRVAYETRVTAAGSLVGPGKANLGSRELNMIATEGTLTPADVNQPFFFAARVRAAAQADESSRIALLRSVLEDYPSSDGPRLPLLRAAMKTGDFHLAIATMKPFLHNHWLDLNSSRGNWYREDYDDSEDDDTTAADDDAIPDDIDVAEAEFASGLNLKNSDKAEICELVGQAFQRLGDSEDALSFFYQAEGLHPAPAALKRIKAEVHAVRKVLAEQRADYGRQPSIHDDIGQASVVRPRLTSIKPKPGAVDFQGGHR